MNNAIAALHIGTNNSGLEIFPFNYGVSAAIYFVHFFYEFESGGSTEHCYRTFFGHFDQLGGGQTFANLQMTFQNCLSLKSEKWYFVIKIFLTYCTVRKKCSSVREKLLKFEAEGREFAKFSRSQFLVTEKIRTIRIQIGKNYWDLEKCRKSY